MPLLFQEAASRELRALHRSDPELVVWWATELECVSAIARRQREGAVTQGAAARALARLDELRRAWAEVEALAAIRRTARRLLRVHVLRAADAVQLAAAIAAADGRPDLLLFVCLDQRLNEAAQREGFELV